MGGSGGSYSGNYGGSGGGGSGGGTPEGGGDPCDHLIEAPIYGPNPAEVAKLSKGSVLDVAAEGTPVRVVLKTPAGATVGSIAGVPGLASLIDCILAGHKYQAEVFDIVGGIVRVRISRIATP